jgi:hypothetical protein
MPAKSPAPVLENLVSHMMLMVKFASKINTINHETYHFSILVRMARVYKELQFSKPGKKLVSSLLTMSPNHQHMSKTPLSDEAFLDDSKVLQALTDYAANRPQRIIKRKVEAELLEVKTG